MSTRHYMLNKHGWGIKEMLVLSGILVLFLIIAIYYIYTLYSDFDKELGNNYYVSMEEDLKSRASIYLDDYYENELTSKDIVISRNVLKMYDLDMTLKDKNGNLCSGYVVANKDRIKAYISCEEYVTSGYEKRSD